MKTSARGLALIKGEEELRLVAYPDGGGVPTIGYGHTRGVKLGDTCSQEQANMWLVGDVGIAESAINASVDVELTQNQFDALVDFTFNLGTGAFERSTLLKLLNARNYKAAAEQLLLWCHDNGVEIAGLKTRREKERALFLS